MNEKLTALFQKIAESDEMQAKLAEFGTLEEAYEFARTLQDGFTKEEFLDACKTAAEAASGDISDEELLAAAGGVDSPDCIPTLTKENTKTVNTRTLSILSKTAVSGLPPKTITCVGKKP